MRYKFLAFCLLFVLTFIKTNAQLKKLKDQKITLHLTNVDVKTVLDTLQGKTQIVYRDPNLVLDKTNKVNVNVDKGSLYELLHKLSNNQVFKLRVSSDVIWVDLKPGWEKKLRSGYVVDQFGKPVEDATIAYKKIGLAEITDSNGNFFFKDSITPNDTLDVYGWTIKDKIVKVGKSRNIRIQVERLSVKVLEKRGIDVSGTVIDNYKKPVANATVSDPERHISTITDVGGGFYLKGVRPNTSLIVCGEAIISTTFPLRNDPFITIQVSLKKSSSTNKVSERKGKATNLNSKRKT